MALIKKEVGMGVKKEEIGSGIPIIFLFSHPHYQCCYRLSEG